MLQLGPLADNGGPTATQAIAAGSVANDFNLAANCTKPDQRGLERWYPGMVACDSGAYERSPFCRFPDLSIPDNNPTGVTDSQSIVETFPVVNLDLLVRLDHTWVGDLELTLSHTGDGAVSEVVFNRPTGPAPAGCSGNDLSLFLDDGAVAAAESNCTSGDNPLRAYSYTAVRPGDPAGNLLASFENVSIAGNWALEAVDHAGGDLGVLREWCLAPRYLMLRDGFESGHTGFWSTAVP